MDHSADIERNWTRFCECGQPKEHNAYSCPGCLFLDGARCGDSLLIDSLRLGIEMTCNDLAIEIGVHATATLRRLYHLIEIGRVRRYWRESDVRIGVQRCRYGTGLKRAGIGGSGVWVYTLCDRRAA